jgi:Trpc4-associated protein
MILVPHQIEVIFVICTLLSGRRKLYIQNSLLELGLPDILRTMFFRMSWNAPTFKGTNSLDHIHGPNCECNPESALRVQYLRLIHNFYDRDFVQCVNKQTMLSAYEIEYIQNVFKASQVEEVHVPTENKGLMSLLLKVLHSEPVDSIYRFWLSSCIESFLRGCRNEEQLFMIQCGINT